jgi:hypothetical protein
MRLKYFLWTALAKVTAPVSGIDYVVIAVLVIVIAAIVFSMVRNRKKGGGCYGCPHSQTCGMRLDDCPSNIRGEANDAE